MKSGLKANDRTAFDSPLAVAVSAAMKSGLKGINRTHFEADGTSSSECRDEKRTESRAS